MLVQRVLDRVQLESVELLEVRQRVTLDVHGRVLLVRHVVPQDRLVDEVRHAVRVEVRAHRLQHPRERRRVPAERHRKARLPAGRRLLLRLHEHFDAVVVDVDDFSRVIALADRVAHLRLVVDHDLLPDVHAVAAVELVVDERGDCALADARVPRDRDVRDALEVVRHLVCLHIQANQRREDAAVLFSVLKTTGNLLDGFYEFFGV